MFSYIFMKILESRPARYDIGIGVLTGGHAGRVRSEIVATWVRPGMEMLDVGCGTGQLLAEAARAGARVTGIDISEAMLAVTRKRIQAEALQEKARLYQAGVTELDSLFADNCFDLITATLVFSELPMQERRWALEEFARILKPSGVLVMADEVIPATALKKSIHFLVRLPLAIITYIVAQTGTAAVSDLAGEISQAGFDVMHEKRSLFGSFALIGARKPPEQSTRPISADFFLVPEDDVSLLKSLWDFCGRWFPNPVDPGLRKIGEAGVNSPVFVTANFHLTVRRVEKALRGKAAWLLVAPTRGINVWCAASGGDMTAHSVISVLKTSRIGARVTHRRLVLPQLAAPGVDRKALENRTGWQVDFGPVYAKDLPAYLSADCRKSSEQSLVAYPLSFRIEMLFAMNALVWLIFAALFGLVNMRWVILGSALFWGSSIVLYAGFPYLPGKSGWLKAGVLAVLEILVLGFFAVLVYQQAWWRHWGWMLAAVILNVWLGFDLKGIVGGNISEAETLMHKLGVKSIGSIFTARPEKTGPVQYDKNKCIHCLTCIHVCPQGVYVISRHNHRVIQKNPAACFNCGACVKQCPSKALSFAVDKNQ